MRATGFLRLPMLAHNAVLTSSLFCLLTVSDLRAQVRTRSILYHPLSSSHPLRVRLEQWYWPEPSSYCSGGLLRPSSDWITFSTLIWSTDRSTFTSQTFFFSPLFCPVVPWPEKHLWHGSTCTTNWTLNNIPLPPDQPSTGVIPQTAASGFNSLATTKYSLSTVVCNHVTKYSPTNNGYKAPKLLLIQVSVFDLAVSDSSWTKILHAKQITAVAVKPLDFVNILHIWPACHSCLLRSIPSPRVP